ncbi:MAG: S9 family peptidase [bacterium]|nr:S9 family peptidase [bacterium]
MKVQLDDLLKTPHVGSVNVSPDARWVVWSWANLGSARDLYVAPVDGSAPARKITDFGQYTDFFSWTADSKHVVVGHDYDGDERVRLYRVDIETLETMPLTPDHPDYYICGGQITPDGKFLVYAANYDFTALKETEISFIYKHDRISGERILLAAPQKPQVYPSIAMNDCGTHVMYARSDSSPAGIQLWLVDINGAEDREILNFGPTSKVFGSWCNTGKEILFVTEESVVSRAGMYSIETNAITWLIDDPDRSIESVVNPYGNDVFKITEVKDGEYCISFMDPESLCETKLPEARAIIPISPVAGDVWLSKFFNSQEPDTLILWDVVAGKILKRITDVFSYVPYHANDLAAAEPYYWESVDGLKIQGWLYRPVGAPCGTIVRVHGGPTSRSENVFDREVQYYVSRGFNVLDPNYRGSTGFGLAFQERIKKDHWGGAEQEDILAGIKALIQDGIAELYKVAITGISYGGYSSWHAITHFPREYVAAAIPICGMTDLTVDYETTRPDCRAYSEEMMGGSPAQVPEIYQDRSPINFVQNITGGLLIIQGAKDPNVSPENLRVVEEKLKEFDIPYETLIFEDEGHGIYKPKNQKTAYQAIADFCIKSWSA